jgi:glycosyltransferase involved in cell wall biosynthesis
MINTFTDTKLAIIIPYYKPDFIQETLNSLQNQTNKNFKLYISDDGSKVPLKELEKVLLDVDYSYKRFENNLGAESLVKHWQRSLDLINNEEWTMILGDDDVLEPNVVNEFYLNYTEVIKRNLFVCRFPIHVIDSSGEILRTYKEHPLLENALDSYVRKMGEQLNSFLSEYVFKTQKLKAIGFKEYPLAWHTDDMLIIQVSDKLPIYSINAAYIYIRMSGVNISTLDSNFQEKKSASIQFLRDILSFSKPQLSDTQFKVAFLYFKRKIGKDFFKYVGLKHVIRFYFGKLMKC